MLVKLYTKEFRSGSDLYNRPILGQKKKKKEVD